MYFWGFAVQILFQAWDLGKDMRLVMHEQMNL